MTVERRLIINADDFGASTGINRGIVDCCTRGVVTSASLMVTGREAREAAAMSRDLPALSVGLHWDVWGEDERSFDIEDLDAVRDEFRRQLDEFERLMGKLPTHFDSHRHAHMGPRVMPIFRELIEPTGRPLRGDGRVHFTGGFYAQWEWKVTNLEYVSVPFLQDLLRREVRRGWNEFSCHPGYRSPDFTSVYLGEREAEVTTLTDARIRQTIEAEAIQLVSYGDFLESKGKPGG